jgi:alkaline phosphatase D
VKTRDPNWFDLFGVRGTRRDFLRVGGSVAGLVALGALPGCGLGRTPRFSTDPFALGVASGDPSPDGVVLWTRLARGAVDGAGVGDRPVDVAWEVAEDPGFARVAASGAAAALPQLGHSVHVEVEGLRPGREYFYRLSAGGDASPVGRTRTAPAAGASVDRLRFAFASCQHFEHGLYTALDHLASEDLDFVAFLGDYIYEYAEHDREAVRRHTGPEIVTLDHYRDRYAQYRADPALQAAHAAAAWIVTTDDHEVDNNYAGTAAEDDQSPEQLLLRRAAAYQAYYEFMPLRRASMHAGPDIPLYRRLAFGDLLEMSVLDTRQYRSDQPCGDRQKPTCAAREAAGQTILGAEQRGWLFDGLAASRSRWNVLAQQVVVAELRGETEEGEDTFSMDKWDGYPAERQALLDLLGNAGVSNPVVLTGDIHSNWGADVKRDFSDVASETVGTEFVGTSLSSGGDGSDSNPRGRSVLDHNPHLHFYNAQRGYVVATVTPERWTSEYRVVPYVTRPGAPIGTRATFVVESGRPGAQAG